MKLFIVATPLFDAQMAVGAYRLRDQVGDRALTIKNDFRGINEVTQSPGLDILKKVGVEPFAADKPLFVDINRIQMIMGNPMRYNLPPKRLVCALPGGLPADQELLDYCATLKEKGYAVALDAFPLSGITSPYFNYASYMCLSVKDPRFSDIVKTMAHQHPLCRLVITDVPNQDAYDKLKKDRDLRRGLFAGAFYNQPVTKGVITVSPLKVNALQLLRELNQDDFELTDVSTIIGRDPALTISLLKYINTSLPNKVDSIQSAVAIMGQQSVKRWGMVAISVNLAEDRPGEVTRLSLIRAKFAENLAGAFELGVFQNHLFITGLFSLLDIILAKPMAMAVKDVAVDERVRKALVDKAGDLYPVLELIHAWERADWDQVSILMIRYGTDIEAVSTAFVNALVWYHKLLASIDEQEREEIAR